jgi:putative zinc finger protein
MSCEEADHLLDTYLDSELDVGRQVELQQHLSLCLSCQLILRERQEFRTFFAATVTRFEAPPQLRAKILTNVRPDQANEIRAIDQKRSP